MRLRRFEITLKLDGNPCMVDWEMDEMCEGVLRVGISGDDTMEHFCMIFRFRQSVFAGLLLLV